MDLSLSPLDPLVLDLCEWVAREPRPHADLIDAWRTSCPRLTVWEEAVERGLVVRDYSPARGAFVRITEKGNAFLTEHGRRCPAPADTAG